MWPAQRKKKKHPQDPHGPMPVSPTDLPAEPSTGYTDQKIYWSVFLLSLLMLAGMVMSISQGALAMSGTIPIPLRLTFSSITIRNVSVQNAISPRGTYLIVTRLDLDANNIELTEPDNLPVIGVLTLRIRANHISLRGLTSTAILGTQRSNDISFPTTLINSATFEGATLTLTNS